MRESLISEIRSVLEDFEVRRAYLFGSRARGDCEDRSDIDIAIDAPDITSAEWIKLEDRLKNLWTLLGVDVVNLSNASEELKSRVLNEGALLYERKG